MKNTTETKPEFTARDYRTASRALNQAGWVCTGGVYPISNSPDYKPVTWVGVFERAVAGSGKAPERFALSASSVGSHSFQRAIGII